MSSNTKQILAITLGSVGLVLGIFAMITAYNAKNATKENENVATQVREEFRSAQQQQDALEATQASKAEKLIAGLSVGEKKLVTKINNNAKGIKKLKKQNKNFKQQLNSLTNRDRQLDNEIGTIENDQQADVNQLNGRINKTNQKVNQNTQSINNLRNRLNVDETIGSP